MLIELQDWGGRRFAQIRVPWTEPRPYYQTADDPEWVGELTPTTQVTSRVRIYVHVGAKGVAELVAHRDRLYEGQKTFVKYCDVYREVRQP